MKNTLKILLSFSVSLLCIYFATRNVRWNELKTILGGAKLFPLLLAALISPLTFFLRAFRWQILLLPFQKIPTLTLMRWQIGGLLINNLLPLRMGEVARAYWSGHKSTISKSTMMATIVIERVLDMASIFFLAVCILLATGFYKSMFPNFNGEKITWAIGLAAAILFAAFFYRNNINQEAILSKVNKILPEKIHGLAEKFISGLKILKNKKEVLAVSTLSLVIWSIDIAILMTVSRSLSMRLNWMESGLVTVGLILGVMVPAAPGAAGTYEAGGVAALSLLGVEKTLALSFILFLHTFQYLYVFTIGIPALLIEGFNPKEMMREMKA